MRFKLRYAKTDFRNWLAKRTHRLGYYLLNQSWCIGTPPTKNHYDSAITITHHALARFKHRIDTGGTPSEEAFERIQSAWIHTRKLVLMNCEGTREIYELTDIDTGDKFWAVMATDSEVIVTLLKENGLVPYTDSGWVIPNPVLTLEDVQNWGRKGSTEVKTAR